MLKKTLLKGKYFVHGKLKCRNIQPSVNHDVKWMILILYMSHQRSFNSNQSYVLCVRQMKEQYVAIIFIPLANDKRVAAIATRRFCTM